MSDSVLSDYPRYHELAYSHGSAPLAAGDFKTLPEDFVVEEVLGFELSGEGEHLWLWVEARDMTTDFMVRHLAAAFELEKKQISFSGKKDRRAVTRQWFSLHVPGRYPARGEIPLPVLAHPDIKILQAELHHKKLRRGTHQQNRFTIRMRQLSGDLGQLSERVASIRDSGFPNYFGLQRFGRQENNIDEACGALTVSRRLKRQARDRIYSTLRAWDFNRQLSLRVASGTWQQYLAGDTLQLSGSRSLFQPDAWDETLQDRLDKADIQVAGILPGKGERRLPLPYGWYEPDPRLLEFLVKQRVEQGTRPLGVRPTDWQCEWLENDLMLAFALPAGAFATGLLRELIQLRETGTAEP